MRELEMERWMRCSAHDKSGVGVLEVGVEKSVEGRWLYLARQFYVPPKF